MIQLLVALTIGCGPRHPQVVVDHPTAQPWRVHAPRCHGAKDVRWPVTIGLVQVGQLQTVVLPSGCLALDPSSSTATLVLGWTRLVDWAHLLVAPIRAQVVCYGTTFGDRDWSASPIMEIR